MTRKARRARLETAIVAAGLTIVAGPVIAQVADTSGLSLADVVYASLQTGPSMQVARQRLDVADGALMVAGGAFGSWLSTSMARGWDNQPGLGDGGSIAAQPTISNSTYQISATRRLRNGLVLRPDVTLTRTSVQAAGVTSTSSAAVNLELVLPLLKDWGGILSRAPERVAEADSRDQRLLFRHTAAVTAREAAEAYWSYVALQEGLAVFVASEARAERLADETRILVAADERPAADLNQLLANVASKRIARIEAEQRVLEAKRRVVLVMGGSGVGIGGLSPAAEQLPLPAGDLEDGTALTFVDSALTLRADLAAARGQVAAARVWVDAGRNDLRPQLDLVAVVGYVGLETGDGLNRFFSPLYSHVPGPVASLQVRYVHPLSNNEGAGYLVQQEAVAAQRRIEEAALAREISAAVVVAVQAVQRGIVAAREAELAATLHRTTLENEREKYRLGSATLFDVILAEDALTNAMLTQVSTRLDFALALATLRFETGALVRDAADKAEVDLDGLRELRPGRPR